MARKSTGNLSAISRQSAVISSRAKPRLLRECQPGCADLPPDDRVSESSRTNADDRLPPDPLGRVEGGDGIVEGCDVADVRPQPSAPHPADDLIQLGPIGLDDEVDRQAGGGRR